jgi:hypothetical protein
MRPRCSSPSSAYPWLGPPPQQSVLSRSTRAQPFLRRVSGSAFRNRIILQNYTVYNIRGSSQLPPRFPLGLRTFAIWLTISSPSSGGSYEDRYNPPRPLTCLLLKPTLAHYANCPISSACRLTRASVLSGHINSVSIAAIIYHASQRLLLRVTLPGLPYTVRPTVSSRSYSVYNPSQASYNCVSLPLTKACNLSSPFYNHLLCPSSRALLCPCNPEVYLYYKS